MVSEGFDICLAPWKLGRKPGVNGLRGQAADRFIFHNASAAVQFEQYLSWLLPS